MFKSYFPYKDKSRTADRVALIKEIWNQREVVLVEGNQTRTGYGNDLLDNAISLERIICPTKEAFDYYDEILAEVKKVDKNKLILVYCRSGRRSKIAAESLSKLGYTNVKEFGGIIDWEYEIEK